MKVTPIGTMLLVELLTKNEMLGTTLYVGDNAEKELAPRAYLRAFGTLYDNEKYGVKLGDEVILTGQYVPTNQKSDAGRDLVLIEFTAIKGVLS